MGGVDHGLGLKVAIFHDYISTIGGGERLILLLGRGLGADVITTDLNRDCVQKMGFYDVNVISLGRVVNIPPFKQIHASIKFSVCNFPGYDFYIFSGNWAHHASARHRPNIWYCHTPVRAFYDLRDYTLNNLGTPLHRLLARLWISGHKRFNEKSLRNIDKIVTNSENTRSRIKKYHKMDAVVIYPPVQSGMFRYERDKNYWLAVNRLYPEKRVPLQVEAFRRLPGERLKIVGWYGKKNHAESHLGDFSNLPDNVEIVGSVSDEELVELYSHCKGLICTAMDEDFGMTPVEAMASGKPVVAVKEGGFMESVVDGVTGRLVEADLESIVKAIRYISDEGSSPYKEACLARARIFDEEVFIEKMKRVIGEVFDCQGHSGDHNRR